MFKTTLATVVDMVGLKSANSLYDVVRAKGEVVESRLGDMIEVRNMTVQFTGNQIPYRPGMSWRLGLMEGLQVVGAHFDERQIRAVAPNLVYEYGLTHAYGLKLAQQLPKILHQLREHPETRRAVAYIGKPEDGGEVDKPCMQSYQFLIRHGALELTVFARSWDLLHGMPYDVMTANVVHQIMAQMVGVEIGRTTFFATSAHLYKERYYSMLPKLSTRAVFSKFTIETDWTYWPAMREWAIDGAATLASTGQLEGVVIE